MEKPSTKKSCHSYFLYISPKVPLWYGKIVYYTDGHAKWSHDSVPRDHTIQIDMQNGPLTPSPGTIIITVECNLI